MRAAHPEARPPPSFRDGSISGDDRSPQGEAPEGRGTRNGANLLSAVSGGPHEAVVDRFAKAVSRHRRRRDAGKTAFGALAIERAQMRKKIGRRLAQVAADAEIERMGMVWGRPEGEKGLVGAGRLRIDAQGRLRRVVADKHSGGLDAGAPGDRPQAAAGCALDVGDCETARPQQDKGVAINLHDRGLNADRRGTAVKDHVDRIAEAVTHVLRAGRT